MAPRGAEILLVRHGETEWTLSRQHTGRTDVPLTDEGRRQAARVGERLRGRDFALVLTSPFSRAAETCELAGLGGSAQTRDELAEWDYGDYEGRTTAEIREERPDWFLWRDGCPGGERAEEVGERADRVIEELRNAKGHAAVFAHGHLLRVLAARWIGQPAALGAVLGLDPAAISVLGQEREQPVLWLWNDRGHVRNARIE